MKKILMVCLGNICRSPLAEGILKAKAVENDVALSVDSCGTSGYHIGETPDPRSIENALENGIDISSLRARQFQVEDFDSFDKIYVMDASNYQDVISHARNQEDKDKVAMILNTAYPASNKSVPDPYFGGETGFQKVFDLLEEACDVIIENLKE